jgi:lysozyme
MSMHVSPAGVALTKAMESLRLKAYPDPATGGAPWTCGWGATGPDINPGTVWTQAQAEARLNADLARAGLVVSSLVHIYITQGQFDALADFVFNVGAGNFRSSTLLRLLNQGDIQGAADQFARWNLANGKVMPGLVMRRDCEKKMFLKPDAVTA